MGAVMSGIIWEKNRKQEIFRAKMRPDVIVLGAGSIGASVALHLVKRGVSVVLADRGRPGEGTSYGNAGVIEGNAIFPPAFPSDFLKIIRVALKRATEANYHFLFLPQIMPWLWAYRAASTPQRLEETARSMRPLFARALAEHETLMEESGAMRYLRKNGWLKIYRNEWAFAATKRERELALEFGLTHQPLDVAGALALEPHLKPIFRHAIFCHDAANVTNPLGVTRAYAARFVTLGGEIVKADARTLHRMGLRWRIKTEEGRIEEATEVVVALGPWAPDVLEPLGIYLPLAVKRGYHLHFHTTGDTALTRPVGDPETGFYITPMEQGIRMTTGVEFAHRDAKKTPAQFDRLMPKARELFPLGKALEKEPWMGSRPCFPDSMPVIGRAPQKYGNHGLWLAYGHAHWGLTLGPVTGRLIAEMMTGETPFCDPAPYRAERFL